MGTNRAAFLVVALAAAAVVGGGAYFATRDNTGQLPHEATAVDVAPAPGAVMETEAVLEDTAPIAPSPVVETPRPPRVEPRPSPTKERPTRQPEAAARPTASRTPSTEPAPEPAPAPPPAPAPSGQPIVVSENVPPEPVAADTRAPEVLATEEHQKQFDELVVSADSVIGLQLEKAVSTETAKIEDVVDARVTRDVRVGNEVAIPAGSRMIGSVTVADRGGKMKGRARLGVRFHTLVLADGTRTSLNTEPLIREGSSPSGESTAKIGAGAIGGAILGAILGGGKGAVIGGTAGAGAGTAAVLSGGRNAAELREGSTVTVRLIDPVTITVER